MDTVINANGVSKHFGEQRALDGIDLRVDAGSILGLIGPNGAGKTTLLRCCTSTSTTSRARSRCWVMTRDGTAAG